MVAVGLGFLLNSCGGDTQVIQVLPAMSAEAGGSAAVLGSGGSGGRASNLVGVVSGGSGGAVATMGSGGAVATSGGAVGTGGMVGAVGGSGVAGGSGGVAAGVGGVGGMVGQTGGVSSGGSAGAELLVETQCKAGMPGTDAGCAAQNEFVWGGHCYAHIQVGIGPGTISGGISMDGASGTCQGWGGELAALNCDAEKSAWEANLLSYPRIGIGGIQSTRESPWVWRNGEPWHYQLLVDQQDGFGDRCLWVNLATGRFESDACIVTTRFLCERPIPGALAN